MTDARAAGAEAEAADAALMLRVQAHDSGAFGALYDRLGSRAYRLAYAVAADRPRAEDIVEAAFLSVWRGADGFRPEHGTVAAWLMGVVRESAKDSLRRHGQSGGLLRGATDSAVDDGAPAVEDRSSEAVEDAGVEAGGAARLRATLERLPPAQRDVIHLAYFGGLTSSEIAQALSLPPRTVKGRMRLGLAGLQPHGDPGSRPDGDR